MSTPIFSIILVNCPRCLFSSYYIKKELIACDNCFFYFYTEGRIVKELSQTFTDKSLSNQESK